MLEIDNVSSRDGEKIYTTYILQKTSDIELNSGD